MLDLSPETEALALSLAGARRVSVDAAVRGALEAQAGASGSNIRIADVTTAIDLATRRELALRRTAEEIGKLPDLDPRSVREITDDLDPL